MIKAIIFDIGGVVTYNIGAYIRNDIVKTLGITKEQYEKACHKLIPLLSTDKISEGKFWEKFVNLTGLSVKPPSNLWSREFAKRRKLRKSVVSIIKRLRSKGLKIAALSNVIKSHSRVNDQKGIYKLFDLLVLSYEVKLRKPNPKIFKLTLKKLGTKPEETVFIDNKLENVEVARKLKINGIYYRNPTQLNKSLARFNL